MAATRARALIAVCNRTTRYFKAVTETLRRCQQRSTAADGSMDDDALHQLCIMGSAARAWIRIFR